VAVGPLELVTLRTSGAASLYRGLGEAFTATKGGLALVGRRADGVCGFLGDDNRCRIHAELGFGLKPLTCRLFPYRLHPTAEGPTIVRASLSCPTVAANQGALVSTEAKALGRLADEWARAFPVSPRALELVAGRSLPAPVAETLRSALQSLLDRPGDLRANLRRIADLLDDLTRWRVRRMPEDRFAEYARIMARHAETSDRAVSATPSPKLTWSTRGVLLAVAATRAQLAGEAGMRLRIRLLRLVAHLHGVGPGSAGVDLRLAEAATLDLADPAVRALVHHVLRGAVTSLGSGEQPLVDELGTHAALLHAATLLARQRAGAQGRSQATADDLLAVIPESMDVLLASGTFAGLVRRLGGGTSALRQLAA
jgi:hypothetical protein